VKGLMNQEAAFEQGAANKAMQPTVRNGGCWQALAFKER